MSREATEHRDLRYFYDAYPPEWRAVSAELIERIGECQMCGGTPEHVGTLTVAHLDQDPGNIHETNLAVACRSCHIQYDQPYHVFSMMTNRKTTDNSHLSEKIQLRLESLEKVPGTGPVRILEAFAGDAIIWRAAAKMTDRPLQILKIEMKGAKKGVYLQGDNRKFLPLFKFENYDIIDLDAYGSPYHQLKVVFMQKFTGIVHCTFTQLMTGVLPHNMLKELGYPQEMIQKCPSIFYRHGLQKMERYLSSNGVEQIHGIFYDRRSYFWFQPSYPDEQIAGTEPPALKPKTKKRRQKP